MEGMGGVWDRCDRQGNWVTATEEAVIAWNAPQPYHPVAVPFINRALENWGGLNWEDRFHHNDRSRAQRGGIGASLQQGVVMSRKKTETQRLPDACYDVRPASKPPRGHNWLQQTVIMCLDLPRSVRGIQPARSARVSS